MHSKRLTHTIQQICSKVYAAAPVYLHDLPMPTDHFPLSHLLTLLLQMTTLQWKVVMSAHLNIHSATLTFPLLDHFTPGYRPFRKQQVVRRRLSAGSLRAPAISGSVHRHECATQIAHGAGVSWTVVRLFKQTHKKALFFLFFFLLS